MKKYLFFADYFVDFIMDGIEKVFPGKKVFINIFEYILLLSMILIIPTSILLLIGNGFLIAGITILFFYSIFMCSALLSLFFRKD